MDANIQLNVNLAIPRAKKAFYIENAPITPAKWL
jgi:hypothetical protein